MCENNAARSPASGSSSRKKRRTLCMGEKVIKCKVKPSCFGLKAWVARKDFQIKFKCKGSQFPCKGYRLLPRRPDPIRTVQLSLCCLQKNVFLPEAPDCKITSLPRIPRAFSPTRYILIAPGTPWRACKARSPGSTSRVPDSVSLGGARKLAFLTSVRVMLKRRCTCGSSTRR